MYLLQINIDNKSTFIIAVVSIKSCTTKHQEGSIIFFFGVQVARRVAARTAERKRQEAEAAAAAAAIAAQHAAEEAEVEEARRQERASFTAIKACRKPS